MCLTILNFHFLKAEDEKTWAARKWQRSRTTDSNLSWPGMPTWRWELPWELPSRRWVPVAPGLAIIGGGPGAGHWSPGTETEAGTPGNWWGIPTAKLMKKDEKKWTDSKITQHFKWLIWQNSAPFPVFQMDQAWSSMAKYTQEILSSEVFLHQLKGWVYHCEGVTIYPAKGCF